MAKQGQGGAAHFYAEIQGTDIGKNPTRMASKHDGHWGHIRGWDCGGLVTMSARAVRGNSIGENVEGPLAVHNGGDVAVLSATRGSNHNLKQSWPVAYVYEKVGGLYIRIHNPNSGEFLGEFIV